MPNPKYADVTLIVDRSGSMSSCCEEAQGGVNTFIADQKKEPGKMTFTLIEFDDTYEVVASGDIAVIEPNYKLRPRGWTSLFDAIGRAIDETGARLAAMKEEDRPGVVSMVIVTDGGENSSKKYKKAKIAEMIKLQQEVYNWKFNFLSSDLSAVEDAGTYGIRSDCSNVWNNAQGAYAASSSVVRRMRSDSASGLCVSNSYTAAEIDKMNGSK